jgi:hypothetical protein
MPLSLSPSQYSVTHPPFPFLVTVYTLLLCALRVPLIPDITMRPRTPELHLTLAQISIIEFLPTHGSFEIQGFGTRLYAAPMGLDVVMESLCCDACSPDQVWTRGYVRVGVVGSERGARTLEGQPKEGEFDSWSSKSLHEYWLACWITGSSNLSEVNLCSFHMASSQVWTSNTLERYPRASWGYAGTHITLSQSFLRLFTL